MAFGKRIKFFRKRSRLTLKALGMFVGFKKKGADVRISQYESEYKSPKEKLVNGLAEALGVSPDAIRVPDIDSFTGLMHTLFAIEDMYGLTILTSHGKPCLSMVGSAVPQQEGLSQYLQEWCDVKMDLLHGRITKTQYDDWRYNYPRLKRERRKMRSLTYRLNLSSRNRPAPHKSSVPCRNHRHCSDSVMNGTHLQRIHTAVCANIFARSDELYSLGWAGDQVQFHMAVLDFLSFNR